MRCSYCNVMNDDNQNIHWAECGNAPDFVRYQAMAELRAAAGGPLAPTDRTYGNRCIHNHIDRNEPECKQWFS